MRIGSYLIFSIFLLSIISCRNTVKDNDELPNIVFIFTDDQTHTAIHALGNEEIITPNLDRLVRNGMTFTNAYNMGAWNGAVCAASRAMIISGRTVWNANAFRQKWIKRDSNALEMTWPRLMEKHGYETYMTGKWHVDAPAEEIFRNVKHVRPGMPPDQYEHFEMMKKFDAIDETDYKQTAMILPNGYNRPLGIEDNSWLPTDSAKGGFWEGERHWSEVLKDDAISFIEKAKEDPQPFFMYLAFNAPHDPRQAPQEYLDMYDLDNISLPTSFLAEYPHKDGIGNGPRLRDESLAPFPRTPYAVRKHIQEYYALITHLDVQIGAIVDALETSGKMDNTYIFFTADHGLAMGRHGLLGKQSMYDHSIRPPFLVVGPDVPKGVKSGADIYLQDIMPTSLQLAGIEIPEFVEFNSFAHQFQNQNSISQYDGIYGGYLKLQRMMRDQNHKLILYPEINKALLFDLNEDPEETNNLFHDPAKKQIANDLFVKLKAQQHQFNDDLDLEELSSFQ